MHDGIRTDDAPELDGDQPRGYESPRLLEYGTLLVTTAGADPGGNVDGVINFSGV